MFGFGKNKDQRTGETQKSHGIGVAKVSLGDHRKNPEFARLWDDSAQYDPERGRERWIIPVGSTKVIDLEGLTGVDVSTMSGRIDVIGHDGPDARLEITNVRQDEVRVGLVNGRLIVAHPQADGRMHEVQGSILDLFGGKGLTNGPSVDVSLMVPREVALRVDCISGDTLASGLTGDVSLDTVSGSVLANGLSGKVKLDAVSGHLEARNHHGRVTANSVSGDVIVSGDCEKISMDSVSGHLYVDAFGRPRKISVDGVSATATIRLDHDIHAKYRVDGMHAKVVIDGVRRKTKFGDDFAYEEGPADAPLTKIHADGVNISLNVIHRDPVTGVDDGAADGDGAEGSAADWARAFAPESADAAAPESAADEEVATPIPGAEREV